MMGTNLNGSSAQVHACHAEPVLTEIRAINRGDEFIFVQVEGTIVTITAGRVNEIDFNAVLAEAARRCPMNHRYSRHTGLGRVG